MKSAVTWFEIPVANIKRSKVFYEHAFQPESQSNTQVVILSEGEGSPLSGFELLTLDQDSSPLAQNDMLILI